MKTILVLSFITCALSAWAAFKGTVTNAFNFTGSENTRGYIEQIEKFAYDSFDPDNFDPDNFDPDNFDEDADNASGMLPATTGGIKPFTVKKGGNFMIKIANAWTNVDAASGSVLCELFNLGKSAAFAANPNVFGGVLPATADKIVDIGVAANLNGYLYFDNSGNLVAQAASGRKITISCQQIPYYFLVQGTATNAFIFKSIKLSYANDGTLDNTITHTTYTFLGGSKTNEITPRDYFRDTQFQSKIVTVPMKGIIGRDNGFTLPVNNTETISLLFTLQAYVKTGL